MAVIDSSLAIPSTIVWLYDAFNTNTEITASTLSYAASKRYTIKASQSTYNAYISWYSTYTTFQVQWRYRKRYSPAHAAAIYGTQGEQFTDWSDWTNDKGSTSEDYTSSTTTMANHATIRFLNFTNWGWSYDYSEYDKIEYEVRVRVYNASKGTCSQWQTQTITVEYKPKKAELTAVQNKDGGVTLTFTTDWARGGSIAIKKAKNTNYPRILSSISQDVAFASSSNLSYSFIIPSTDVTGLTLTSNRLCASSYIFNPNNNWESMSVTNAPYYAAAKNCSIPLAQHTEPAEVKEPKIWTEGDVVHVAPKTSPAKGDYSSVFLSSSWTDADGNAYASEVALTEDDNGTWTGTLIAPPYDTALTLRATASIASGEFATTQATHTIASCGRFSWTLDSGAGVDVRLHSDEANVSLSESLESETVQTAGRSRPISRHGTGGTRSISCTGAIMRGAYEAYNESFNQDSHTDITNILRTQADMWFRTPYGGRYRVIVTDFSLSQNAAYEELSVNMEEVSS